MKFSGPPRPIIRVATARPAPGKRGASRAVRAPGTPPAAKFDIAGIDECPQAKNCQIETVVRDGALRRSAQRYHTAFFRQEF